MSTERFVVLALALLFALIIALIIVQTADAGWCRVVWQQYFDPIYGWVSYPAWCCGVGYQQRCQAACYNYYGGFGPCW